MTEHQGISRETRTVNDNAGARSALLPRVVLRKLNYSLRSARYEVKV